MAEPTKMPGNGPVEPSADLREYASFMFQTFTALVLEGFTEQQALTIMGHTIRGSFGGGDGS